MSFLRKSFAFVVCILFFALPAAAQSTVTATTFTPVTNKPDVDVVTGDSGTSAFRIFNSSNAGLFSINGAGDVIVGGGTSAQYGGADRFYVFENADTGTAITVDNPNAGTTAAGMFRAQSDAASVNVMSHGASRTIQRFGVTLGGWSEIFHWRGNGMIVGTSINAPLILGTNNQNRVHIKGDGNVGIGTNNPNALLDVNGNAHVAGSLTVDGNFSAPANTGAFSVGGTAPSGFPFYATSSAATVGAAIQLHSNYAYQSTSFVGNFGNYGTYLSHNRNPQTGAFTDDAASPNQANAVNVVLGDTMPGRNRMFTLENYPGGTETVRMLVRWNGQVGIGAGVETLMDANPDKELVVNGDIQISGNINAKYQDFAEWVPASSDLAPGTVVVLDPSLGNGVTASTTPYDTRVAGVVSAKPGIILGEGGASKEQIATSGRVRVKVDATQRPIAVGDLLVTSDRPGFAMRSIPVDIAGVAIHRPGTIVGKALEALAGGEGEILVLLSLQ